MPKGPGVRRYAAASGSDRDLWSRVCDGCRLLRHCTGCMHQGGSCKEGEEWCGHLHLVFTASSQDTNSSGWVAGLGEQCQRHPHRANPAPCQVISTHRSKDKTRRRSCVAQQHPTIAPCPSALHTLVAVTNPYSRFTRGVVVEQKPAVVDSSNGCCFATTATTAAWIDRFGIADFISGRQAAAVLPDTAATLQQKQPVS